LVRLLRPIACCRTRLRRRRRRHQPALLLLLWLAVGMLLLLQPPLASAAAAAAAARAMLVVQRASGRAGDGSSGGCNLAVVRRVPVTECRSHCVVLLIGRSLSRAASFSTPHNDLQEFCSAAAVQV
jgi:cell division protein FtsW (lipid II flippase)